MADNDNRDDYIDHLVDEVLSLESSGEMNAEKKARISQLKSEISKLSASITATSSELNKKDKQKENQNNSKEQLGEQSKNSSILSALCGTKLDTGDVKNIPSVKSKNNTQSL